MSTTPEVVKDLVRVVDELRAEVARLGTRLEALEKTEHRVVKSTMDADLAIVIGAAVAAYLGKRPHIRQIRLLGSAAWAQEGRVTIQASHAL